MEVFGFRFPISSILLKKQFISAPQKKRAWESVSNDKLDHLSTNRPSITEYVTTFGVGDSACWYDWFPSFSKASAFSTLLYICRDFLLFTARTIAKANPATKTNMSTTIPFGIQILLHPMGTVVMARDSLT
mmetsp:Transcript_17747/g.43789  ORF Transcript_17747/g.43789 Transcript_17747/m.43789 type:complete len:131 (-) Transcript_17747:1711-2103(-)